VEVEEVSDNDITSSEGSASDVEPITDSHTDTEIDQTHGYIQQRTKRRKRMRESPEITTGHQSKVQKDSTMYKLPSKQTKLTVYMKGKKFNLAKSLELINDRAFKRNIANMVGEVKCIDCKHDSVRILCKKSATETHNNGTIKNW